MQSAVNEPRGGGHLTRFRKEKTWFYRFLLPTWVQLVRLGPIPRQLHGLLLKQANHGEQHLPQLESPGRRRQEDRGHTSCTRDRVQLGGRGKKKIQISPVTKHVQTVDPKVGSPAIDSDETKNQHTDDSKANQANHATIARHTKNVYSKNAFDQSAMYSRLSDQSRGPKEDSLRTEVLITLMANVGSADVAHFVSVPRACHLSTKRIRQRQQKKRMTSIARDSRLVRLETNRLSTHFVAAIKLGKTEFTPGTRPDRGFAHRPLDSESEFISFLLLALRRICRRWLESNSWFVHVNRVFMWPLIRFSSPSLGPIATCHAAPNLSSTSQTALSPTGFNKISASVSSQVVGSFGMRPSATVGIEASKDGKPR